MCDTSFTSLVDSIDDPDYSNPFSPIEVSDFENISEYERLVGIQNNEHPVNAYKYDDEVRVVENSDDEEDIIQLRAGKKKTTNILKWKRNGVEHISLRGKHILSRETGPDCKCRNKCFIKVNDEEKNTILKTFNKIGNKEKQDTYIAGLIKIHKVVRHRPLDHSKPKSCVCKYKVKTSDVEKVVCKKAFCSILGIKKFRVERIVKLLQNNEPSPVDKRGKHINRGNAKNEQIIFQISTHIESFSGRHSH